MEERLLQALETPCIVIDEAIARKNIQDMQNMADAAGCLLRPHIKTHKMVHFARLQMEAGAAGITCAKISEAEVMAAGGIEDIFVAYPLIGSFRINRAIVLHQQIKRLILAVDSLAGAQALSAAAVMAGVTLEVRLEVETGAKRTGVSPKALLGLAKAVAALPGLLLTGIYTFKSLVLNDAPTTDRIAAGKEEGQLMASFAKLLRGAGIDIRDVSAGSTPTGDVVAKTGLVNEIRPGTYIFNDHMLCCEGWAAPDSIAAHLYATVVSVHDEYAVIDGGTKTFPMDIPLDVPPYQYKGYALVDNHPGLCLRRMNEEHGILQGRGVKELKIGQVLRLTPIHICTAVNLQNTMYILNSGHIHETLVDARGMLT